MSAPPPAGGRVQLSEAEVKAQRAAKAAEKAARAEKAAEKKKQGGAAAAPAPKPAASPAASIVAPTPTSASGSAAVSASNTPRQKPMKSPALTPSHGSAGAGSHAPPFTLGERRDSVVPGRERSGSGGGSASGLPSGKPKLKEAASMKRPASQLQHDDPKKAAAFNKQSMVSHTLAQKAVPLFSHLPQYERATSLSLKLKVGFSSEEIHPAILRLGLQYASGNISGANARCVAMLTALKQFIMDYSTPPAKVMRDDLLQKLKPLVRFLIDSRPQSMSMGNAIRYVKMKISKIGLGCTEARAKAQLVSDIDNFISERIEFADEVITSHGVSKIHNGDVILTYATSHVVEMILSRAHAEAKQFRVIIVDSRPKLEGKELLRRLVQRGIQCTYIMINALSYVMKDVSKVFLGAAALLSNGSVISRVGSAVVSMMAKVHSVPVLVCCETYKFHEMVKLDSIGFNELGDPDDLMTTGSSSGAGGGESAASSVLVHWRDMTNLKLLNLVFDLTPVELVTMVISEIGLIPPTSVPVILREYHKDDSGEGGE